MLRYFPQLRLIAAATLVLLLARPAGVDAQAAVTWSEPVNLSNSLTGSVNPAILADPYGNVHVFWSEDMNGEPVGIDEELQEAPNTIMYRRWDGTSWSKTVDVLAVPTDAVAEYVAADVDPAGTIHVTWTGQTNVYYSSVPASQAGDVHAWTQPVVLAVDNARSMRESAVACSPDGTTHVIYATRGAGAGVYHVSVNDEGTILAGPVAISAPLTSLEQGYANVRLISDGGGHLHATWQTFQRDGYGQGVYYTQSLDDGATWSAPLLLRSREAGDTWVEWPYLTAGRGDDLYLTYVDGTNKGRAFRVSRDGGATWSKSKPILDELEGINGFVATVIDGAGQVHLLAPMRTRAEQANGIYYSFLSGDTFVPTTAAVVDGHAAATSAGIHYLAATVRLGNEIDVVWNEIDGSEIWYMKGVIKGVDPTPARAVPVSVARSRNLSPTPTPAAPAHQTSLGQITPAAQPTPETAIAAAQLPAESSLPPGQVAAPWTPIAVAVAPVLLLLTGVAVAELRKR